jgi:glycosyltransferase involved in cell wall biosynthesis
MVYFLIPVFNEEGNIPLLSEKLNSVLPDYDKCYVFVDDFSTDNSIKTINNCFDSNQLKIITKEENRGPGDSFNLGFEWILTNSIASTDIIVTLEADNTSDLNILNTMIMLCENNYSLVLASVYAQGGGFDQTSFMRRTISFFSNIIFRFIFDVKVLTLSSFYRVHHIEIIKKIKSKYGIIISESGFISMVELLIKSINSGAKIIEVPMTLYSGQRKGKSKMKVVKTSFSYMKFIFNYPKIFKSKIHG